MGAVAVWVASYSSGFVCRHNSVKTHLLKCGCRCTKPKLVVSNYVSLCHYQPSSDKTRSHRLNALKMSKLHLTSSETVHLFFFRDISLFFVGLQVRVLIFFQFLFMGSIDTKWILGNCPITWSINVGLRVCYVLQYPLITYFFVIYLS